MQQQQSFVIWLAKSCSILIVLLNIVTQVVGQAQYCTIQGQLVCMTCKEIGSCSLLGNGTYVLTSSSYCSSSPSDVCDNKYTPVQCMPMAPSTTQCSCPTTGGTCNLDPNDSSGNSFVLCNSTSIGKNVTCTTGKADLTTCSCSVPTTTAAPTTTTISTATTVPTTTTIPTITTVPTTTTIPTITTVPTTTTIPTTTVSTTTIVPTATTVSTTTNFPTTTTASPGLCTAENATMCSSCIEVSKCTKQSGTLVWVPYATCDSTKNYVCDATISGNDCMPLNPSLTNCLCTITSPLCSVDPNNNADYVMCNKLMPPVYLNGSCSVGQLFDSNTCQCSFPTNTTFSSTTFTSTTDTTTNTPSSTFTTSPIPSTSSSTTSSLITTLTTSPISSTSSSTTSILITTLTTSPLPSSTITTSPISSTSSSTTSSLITTLATSPLSSSTVTTSSTPSTSSSTTSSLSTTQTTSNYSTSTFTPTSTSSHAPCPTCGYASDPNNCTIYYNCFDGSYTPRQCPTGLCYIESECYCDIVPLSTTSTSPSSSTSSTTHSPCPACGYAADPADCNTYYDCYDGSFTPKQCPSGLCFVESECYCDVPQTSSTTINGPTPSQCPPCGYAADSTACNTFYYCLDGTFTKNNCPVGMCFIESTCYCDFVTQSTTDSTTSTTTPTSTPTLTSTSTFFSTPTSPPPLTPTSTSISTPSSTSTSTSTSQCPACGYLANPNNSTTYYYCGDGSYTLYTCPSGLNFNQGLCYCDVTPIITPGCPGCGYIGDPINCQTYYFCKDGSNAVVTCPTGMCFMPGPCYCDFPAI